MQKVAFTNFSISSFLCMSSSSSPSRPWPSLDLDALHLDVTAPAAAVAPPTARSGTSSLTTGTSTVFVSTRDAVSVSGGGVSLCPADRLVLCC